VGPPGCGKTTFATRAIPLALGRPVQVVNLGGAKDSAVLLGHNYTYEGSRIGQVVRAFSASGVCDPVLVFDELDKVSDTAQGREIVHVLMSLTDPAQNGAFADTYLSGVPVDLSRALMVFTFNDAAAIDPVLLDRIQVVRVPDASRAEKRDIVRRFVLPKIAEACGLVVDDLAPEALDALVSPAQGASSASSDMHMHAGGGGLRGIERVLERALLSANVRSIRAKVPAATRIQVGVEDIREAARDADGGRSALAFPSMYS
jgi:ATP-dependent Lon protease